MLVGVLTILNRIKRSVVIAQYHSEPDSMLCVMEGAHGTNKPLNSMFIELGRNHLLDVQYFFSQQDSPISP
jgi:hypothetical protein